MFYVQVVFDVECDNHLEWNWCRVIFGRLIRHVCADCKEHRLGL